MKEQEACGRCDKPPHLCVCEAIAPAGNRLSVVILRHPQEQDRALGTARIASLQLDHCVLKTGLSWRNLAKVAGRTVDPKRWGVLYLGTAVQQVTGPKAGRRILTAVDKKGQPVEGQDSVLKGLEGIVLLDGNWQQAKTLWWRNPWMLKCRRLMLHPPKPSLYGTLRKEPRRESLSTIEAAAYALGELEGDPGLVARVLKPFELLLAKARRGGQKKQVGLKSVDGDIELQ